MLVDSHCHLDYLEEPIEAIRQEAKELGVHRFLTIGVEEKNWEKLLSSVVSHSMRSSQTRRTEKSSMIVPVK